MTDTLCQAWVTAVRRLEGGGEVESGRGELLQAWTKSRRPPFVQMR